MMILAKKALVYKLGKDITVENTDNLKGFSDYEDISAYALESLSAMVKDGYVKMCIRDRIWRTKMAIIATFQWKK